MRILSDALVIGVDMSSKDKPIIVIARRNPRGTLNVINKIEGQKAIEVYEILTNENLKAEKVKDILYACDEKACDHPCSEECSHTTDISHAKSFSNKNGVYIEKVNEKKPFIGGGYGKIYCPNCLADIHGMERIKYCPNCGQEIDWDCSEPYKTCFGYSAKEIIENSKIIGKLGINLKGEKENE